jgi:predicted secreted protein
MLDINNILKQFHDITIKNSNQIKNSLDLKRTLLKSIDTIYQQQRKCENCSKEEVSKSKLFYIEFQKQKKQKLANSTKQILEKRKNIETVNLSSKKRKEL